MYPAFHMIPVRLLSDRGEPVEPASEMFALLLDRLDPDAESGEIPCRYFIVPGDQLPQALRWRGLAVVVDVLRIRGQDT